MFHLISSFNTCIRLSMFTFSVKGRDPKILRCIVNDDTCSLVFIKEFLLIVLKSFNSALTLIYML